MLQAKCQLLTILLNEKYTEKLIKSLNLLIIFNKITILALFTNLL